MGTEVTEGAISRCRPDLNRGIRVLQTLALPLGHGTVCCDGVFNTTRGAGQGQIVSVPGRVSGGGIIGAPVRK